MSLHHSSCPEQIIQPIRSLLDNIHSLVLLDARSHLFQYLSQTLGALLGIEPDHADRGAIIKNHGEYCIIIHKDIVDMIFISLMKENGKILLSHKFGHRPCGRKRAGDQGRQGIRINRLGESFFGDTLPILIHQDGAFGIRLFEKIHQDLVNLCHGFFG